MARKAIREYHAKMLLAKYLPEFFDLNKWVYDGELIECGIDKSIKMNKKMVVKPDQLFGKRGKNGLIHIAENKVDALDWIESKVRGKVKVIRNETDNGINGQLTHFLVESFVPHDEEFYLAIKSGREFDTIYFSESGGIDIEENWDSVSEINIPYTLKNEPIVDLIKLDIANKQLELEIKQFISSVYQVFKKIHFTYLELNPFVITDKVVFVPLDMVARLDSTAEYEMEEFWVVDGEKIEFPQAFGAEVNSFEATIEELDSKTGSSLKLTILNPNGRIWLLTAGGGASVIFADTVGDIGDASELGNYGEYSGNPSQDETEAYCSVLFDAMFSSKAKKKVLIIGGGIANFTDVAETFKGVIKAIEKHKSKFTSQKVKIFVRRGGPNYEEGLRLIKEKVGNLGIEIKVNGPETHMTKVVRDALEE